MAPAPSETFDFIVVGGGTAGCVLADRLSADGRSTVCLIEAGPVDRHPLIHVPVGMMGLINHKRLNWGYSSVAQPGLDGRIITVPRGRMLGGSGGFNGMVYTRGHRIDYDDWRAAGNVGWGYEEVLPYFRRSEDNLDIHDEWHGKGGPLTVATVRRPNALTLAFLAAAAERGFARNDDINGAEQDGFGLRQVTIRDGRRVTSATAFLRRALQRRNLHVMTGADASRIVISDGRAIAVELVHGGVSREVVASREIVLCAGTFGSPAILMRSGIGDGSRLSAAGIEPVHHLPGVGQNLADHPSAQIVWEGATRHSYGISAAVLPRLAGEALSYAIRRKGMFASNIFEAAGYVRTQPGVDRPDVQIVFCPAMRRPGGTLGVGHGYAFGVVVLRPKSRGSVGLRGPDPDSGIAIDLGLFRDSADLEAMARGLVVARGLASADAFRPFARAEISPGDAVGHGDLQRFARATAATAFHPVGTCRMGVDDDAVVDPCLRVRGIAGLRVADASIMPSIIGGNTNAPVIMIAEKASDLLLEGRAAVVDLEEKPNAYETA